MITLTGKELVAVHLLLKSNEMVLDETLQCVLQKTEKVLYDKLSVEDLENLSQLYRDNLDILT